MTRAAVALLLALTACKRAPAPTPTPTTAAAPATPTPSPTPTPAPTPTPTPTPDPFSSAAPVAGKSIGHTSVVFKLSLEGGETCAYKPRSRRGPLRYKGEIAAYRLGVALGIPNVPRAVPRAFDAGALRGALVSSGASALFDAEAIVTDGKVMGALMPWIHGLDFVPLEAEPWRSRWRAWLTETGEIPPDQTKTAAAISDMIVFDFVTANFDRWSGGNVGRDKDTGTLLFIDNDGAFYEKPYAAPLARQWEILRGVQRFSKSFVKALEGLGPDEMRAAMGEESAGVPLLSDRALAGVEERRTRALAEIAPDELYFE